VVPWCCYEEDAFFFFVISASGRSIVLVELRTSRYKDKEELVGWAGLKSQGPNFKRERGVVPRAKRVCRA
jgi:hypothetical protein